MNYCPSIAFSLVQPQSNGGCWVLLETFFWRSLTLCIWPDSEPTKLLDHPKQNLRGEGSLLQTDKHLPQSHFTGKFCWMTTFCFRVYHEPTHCKFFWPIQQKKVSHRTESLRQSNRQVWNDIFFKSSKENCLGKNIIIWSTFESKM